MIRTPRVATLARCVGQAGPQQHTKPGCFNVSRCFSKSGSFTNPSKFGNPVRYSAVAGLALTAGVALLNSTDFNKAKGLLPRAIHNDGPAGDYGSGWKDVKVTEKPKPSDNEGGFKILPDWARIGDRIADVVVPEWAQALPGFVDKLQDELSASPGTLADEIWKEAHDPAVHPEILREAVVRVSSDLCEAERRFLEKRKQYTKKALAKYLDLNEEDVHPDDVPVIAMCGSGGGLRALVAGSSSYLSAQEAGLFDCVTYTAGVSGSCWLQALYYSSLTGQRHDGIIEHLKNRIGTHIAFPPTLLKLITSAPTNKFLLSGGYEKYRSSQNPDFGLVDAYGLMLGARLLVPKGDLAVDDGNLKLSHQTKYIKDGAHPLPIYTAVRHEIPGGDSDEKTTAEADEKTTAEAHEKATQESWFQWFEWTPYEFWSEELGAGIPTWAVGRKFEGGRNVWQEDGLGFPEVRLPLLMGIFGSAFCATLSHYYKEIRPLLLGLSGFGGLDELLQEKDDDLVKVHPIDPARVPNFAIGMREQLPESCPESIHAADSIQLMDAGMSNNLPIYPLLRPGRDVDILIAFDASADIKQDNWLRVADGYARQRGIKGWPLGTGWPGKDEVGPEQTGEALNEADATAVDKAEARVEEASEDQERADEDKAKQAPKSGSATESDLGYCNIWVGTTEERTSDKEPPRSKRVEADWQLMEPDAGIAVVYFPFMANPAVEGVDPQKTDFMSTWNFIYTPEQIDKVVSLARANFEQGKESTKMCVRAVYERKRRQREEREQQERKRGWEVAT